MEKLRELDTNYEMTKEEYLQVMNRVAHLRNIICNMHGSLSGMDILSEYKTLRQKLQNTRIVDTKERHK